MLTTVSNSYHVIINSVEPNSEGVQVSNSALIKPVMERQETSPGTWFSPLSTR